MKKNLIMAMFGAAMMLVPMVSCQKSAEKTAETETTETEEIAPATIEANDSIADLFKANVDKYPTEANLLANEDLKTRLTELLGQERYDFLAANFNVESPIEEKDDLYTAYACQQNNCSETNFTIIYDAKSNVLSVIYRVDGNDETFTEK